MRCRLYDIGDTVRTITVQFSWIIFDINKLIDLAELFTILTDGEMRSAFAECLIWLPGRDLRDRSRDFVRSTAHFVYGEKKSRLLKSWINNQSSRRINNRMIGALPF